MSVPPLRPSRFRNRAALVLALLMVRRASTDNFGRIEHLLPQLEIRQADLLDQLSLLRLLEESRPRARRKLGWAPKVKFPELIRMMVQADLDRYQARARA
jgi:GDP-D-mannose dehydratase